MQKNVSNIDSITSAEELLSLYSLEEIKKAVKDSYEFNIAKYKKYFSNYLQWFFVSPNEAILKKNNNIYAVISLYNYNPFYLVLYNTIDVSKLTPDELTSIGGIIRKVVKLKQYDDMLYTAIAKNRLTSIEDAELHLLSQNTDSIINFIIETSRL